MKHPTIKSKTYKEKRHDEENMEGKKRKRQLLTGLRNEGKYRKGYKVRDHLMQAAKNRPDWPFSHAYQTV